MASGNAVTRRKLLSLWYFEDQLKEIYTSYVLALNSAAHDSVESNKEKAITAMYKLLAGNPEQEKVSGFTSLKLLEIIFIIPFLYTGFSFTSVEFSIIFYTVLLHPIVMQTISYKYNFLLTLINIL